ncbi:hypothetical protein H0H93_010311 [Arthromyces matolae]|nr:hypothetical protein H0H93_010311 [Arthromyces matolae]
MPDDIVPAGQKCPVGTKKYPKRPHEAIDEAVDKEHAVGVLTGQFGTKEPENKELMAKFQQLARLADGQHDAHCELLEIEGKLKDRKIDKGDAGITLKRVIDLHGQVSIDDHKEVASSIIRCIVLDPELEPKLEEKLAKKLEPESARMLILKVQAALAYLRKKAKGSGSGHAAPLLPHSKRARRS